MENNEWVSWEYYLLVLGARSIDSAYNLPEIYNNIEYFKNCWQNHISQYKALEFLSFELDNKI